MKECLQQSKAVQYRIIPQEVHKPQIIKVIDPNSKLKEE
jgi:hypothetical protein